VWQDERFECVVCIFALAELFLCGIGLGVGIVLQVLKRAMTIKVWGKWVASCSTHKGGLTISHYLDCSPNVVSIFKEVNKLVLVVTVGLVSVSLLRTFRPSASRAS
jgi:hypothetical protein